MPMTCSGRFVRAAISVIEIELVFVARIGVRLRERSRSAKILNLRSRVFGRRFDDERRVVRARRGRTVEIDARRGSRPCRPAWIVPFLICRSRFFAIVARPLSSASAETSIIVTSNPLCANTCAMPLPICPAPITAMRSAMCSTPSGGDRRRVQVKENDEHCRHRGGSRLRAPGPPVSQSGPVSTTR